MRTLMQIAEDARRSKYAVAKLGTNDKNRGILAIADTLMAHADEIIAANRIDIENGRAAGLNDGLIDRLMLDEKRIAGIAEGCRQVAALPDPVGEVLWMHKRPNGLNIGQKRVPMGVIGIIYEARPNVTVDAAVLCFKAGSACILRGGKEAFQSSMCLTRLMREALAAEGLPENAINLVEDTSRASANELMTASGYVDLLIPRGGAGLIRACVDNATVPVIETGTGICHIYVDQWADQGMALDILENAKCSRPSVCNAAEVCLVDRKIAGEFLPKLKARLVDGRAAAGQPPVELRLDETAAAVIDGAPAGERDFDTEFLDYILAVRVVDGVEGAVAHIAAHSTGHSECIVTGDEKAAHAFQRQVDSAAVYWNASTRFTDGGEFGLGCEMGISTQKLHARGPLGLAELCTFKFIARGSGQIR